MLSIMGIFSHFLRNWIVVVLVLAVSPARGEVKYSRIDRATVRVFSIRGVDIMSLTTKSGHSYRLAVPDVGHGSGIRISRDGLILTAYHVVEKARFVAVRSPGEERARPARVVYANKEHDYAFVSVPGTSDDIVPLPDKAPDLAVRQPVFAVGYPLDADRDRPQSNRGIVAGVLRDGSLQLDIAVNWGNSGGPIMDEHEALLGIVVARGDPRKGIEGIGVAVPLERILDGYRHLPKTGRTSARAAFEDTSDPSWMIAALVASVTQRKSVLGIVQEATAVLTTTEGDADGAVILPKLNAAIRATNGQDADVLALAAAYQWNAAAVAKDLGKDYRERYRRALALVEKADKLDPTLKKRSKFVAALLDDEE